MTNERGKAGIPLLDGCSARFQCRTAFKYEGGDHMISMKAKPMKFDLHGHIYISVLATLFIAAAALTALIIFGTLPGGTKLSQVLQNAAHAPAFFVLSLIFLQLRRNSLSTSSFTWRPYLQTFLICLALGIGIELIQALIGSDASSEDVLTDTLGTLAGLAGYAYFERRRIPRKIKNTANILLTISLAAILIAIAPLAFCLAAYINRTAHFPVLAEFHSPLNLYFFKPQNPPLEIQSSSLLVPLAAETWPGVTLEEPAPNWTGYRNLIVDLANPGDTPLRLTIRVHDHAHNQEINDRYNEVFEIAPQTGKKLTIPLSTIQAAPKTRPMDMTQIAGIIIFGNRNLAGRSFYLNRIWLE